MARGLHKSETTDLDVVSYYECDATKIRRIKIAMLDAYDMLVEEDAANDTRLRQRGKPLAPPSLVRIRKAMPFWVNERLATEVRRQLIESGDIKEIRKASPQAASNGLKRISPSPNLEVIEVRKQEVKQKNEDDSRDKKPSEARVPVHQMSPREASQWARTRYNEAWRNIQGLHLKAMVVRLADAMEHLDLHALPSRDETFGEPEWDDVG